MAWRIARILGNYLNSSQEPAVIGKPVVTGHQLPPVTYRQPGVEPPVEVRMAGFDTGRPYDSNFNTVVDPTLKDVTRHLSYTDRFLDMSG
ncbi:MAG: hypothetical protein HY368_03215 [Candidatus Aenigmarchaeota archaeon]|nr:hypothetical protein [Candidatus Aenigmarchaeota archaeon]